MRRIHTQIGDGEDSKCVDSILNHSDCKHTAQKNIQAEPGNCSKERGGAGKPSASPDAFSYHCDMVFSEPVGGMAGSLGSCQLGAGGGAGACEECSCVDRVWQ